MGKHIILAGGGHAHLETIANIHKFTEKGHRVTLISPEDRHYYSGMAPGLIEGSYKKEEISFNIKSMVEKQGNFIQGEVIHLDPLKNSVTLKDNSKINFDLISFNTGSVIKDIPCENSSNIFKAKPISNILLLQKKIIELTGRDTINISVIGGGPAGVEISANIASLLSGFPNIRIFINLFTGSGLLTEFPVKIKKKAKNHLLKKGVNIIKSFVLKVKDNIIFTSQKTFESQITVLASGVQSHDIFSRSGLKTGPYGDLLVNRYLQTPDYPHILGGGDCISFGSKPISKVGVHAVYQNKIILNNLLALLDKRELTEFKPRNNYLQILNMGDNTGILKKGNFILSGKIPFLIKNYIDRKFMKKYKAFEQVNQ